MALDTKKLVNLILHLAGRSDIPNLGMVKLYKLIFFCDVTHLREHGTSITGSDYIKFQHGPVPSRAERQLKNMRKAGSVHTDRVPLSADCELHQVKSNEAADLSVFVATELAVIDSVAKQLGGKTASDLSDMSHDEPAWIEAEMLQKLDHELMHYGRSEDPDEL